MAIEIIRPKNREAWLRARGQDVTASTIGALFGGHEFITTMQLWAIKTGRLPASEEETPQMQRGRLLEPVAVALLKERYPRWKIAYNAAENIYYRDPEARLGGTPDVIVTARDRGKGVIQIKSVEASVYRRKWIDEEGNPEPPFWIVLQALLEAHLTGAEWAAIAPLVVGHGLDMPLIEVPLVDGVVDAMKLKSAEFWQMVEEGREPQPDFARDGALIDRLYAEGDPEDEVDLTGDNRLPRLIEERAELLAGSKVCQDRITEIDAEVKAKLGHAQVGHLAGGRKITFKTVKRAGFFVEPKQYRVLRYPSTYKE